MLLSVDLMALCFWILLLYLLPKWLFLCMSKALFLRVVNASWNLPRTCSLWSSSCWFPSALAGPILLRNFSNGLLGNFTLFFEDERSTKLVYRFEHLSEAFCQGTDQRWNSKRDRLFYGRIQTNCINIYSVCGSRRWLFIHDENELPLQRRWQTRRKNTLAYS